MLTKPKLRLLEQVRKKILVPMKHIVPRILDQNFEGRCCATQNVACYCTYDVLHFLPTEPSKFKGEKLTLPKLNMQR